MNPPTGAAIDRVATKRTYSGRPIPPLVRGLPKTVESICPECLRLLPARLYEEAGQVRMQKTCPEHGLVNGEPGAHRSRHRTTLAHPDAFRPAIGASSV